MKYDLIIAGGGTAGCSCAYTAASLGLKVLLLEKNSFLGGSMTSGLVTPAMKTSYKNINTDFYKKLMNELHSIGGQITYSDGNIGWFNPELMKVILDKLLSEVGVDILFNTGVYDLKTECNFISGVYIENSKEYINTIDDDKNDKSLLEYIETNYVVDATGDAKIFEKLNLKFLEKNKNFQYTNLRFIMSGINLNEFSDWILSIDKDRSITSSYNIDNQVHLSTAYTWDNDKHWAFRPIFEQGIAEKLITKEDSNYFQCFTIPGMPSALAFNCPRILSDVNINDKRSVSNALIAGRESILRLSVFMKKHFKGFENSYISNIANSLGVRLSNRIKGKYIYSVKDLKSGKIFNNPCLISDYPIDIHSSKSKLENIKKEYMLPIDALKSDKYDNLYAVGRCISADFESQAALRIIPSCFSMGEGLAKYIYNSKK